MRKLPPTREMIDALIATPSVSSTDPAIDRSNRPVVDRLANWAEGLGFAVEVLPVPGVEGKRNLVATLGDGPGGFVLSGHTDTVPFDESRWSSDPFVATERDGRLHGLGTADMKSFLALALEAASHYEARDLAEPIVVVGTADEECTMAGARALRDAGRAPGRRAIIGEPTSLTPVRLHKGIVMRAVRLLGRSGHSSNPALGRSALDGMYRVLGALIDYREELAATHAHEDFDVPHPTMNLGRIRGGDAPNRICAACEVQLDMRILPGMDNAAILGELDRRVAAAVAETGLEVEHPILFDGIPPFETPADAELVRVLEEMTGRASGSVAFGTEGPFYAELGMETVVLGPGSIDVAHQPDEYLPLDSIEPTVSLLRQLIERFCVRRS